MENKRTSENTTNETEKRDSRLEMDSQKANEANNDPRMRKRPEMVRYQPPSSRSSNDAPPTSSGNEAAQSSNASSRKTPAANGEKQRANNSNNRPRPQNASNNKPSRSTEAGNSKPNYDRQPSDRNIIDEPNPSTSSRNNLKPPPQTNHSKPGLGADSTETDQMASNQRDRNRPVPKQSERPRESEPRLNQNAQSNKPSANRANQRPERANQTGSNQTKGNKSDSPRASNQNSRPPKEKTRNENNERRLFNPDKPNEIPPPSSSREPTAPLSTIRSPPTSLSSSGGGLLKLNASALNQIKASSNDRMTSSASSMFTENHASDDMGHDVSSYATSRSSNSFPHHQQQHQHPHSRRATNRNNVSRISDGGDPAPPPNGQLKMLFDPSNPNKPIYVQEKKSNPRNQYTFSKVAADVSKLSISPKADHIYSGYSAHGAHGEPRYEQAIRPVQEISFEAHEVQMIAQDMLQYEQKLKILIDLFDIRQSIEQFVEEIGKLRQRIEDMCLQCIFTHIETASNLNVELNHWRSCYHQLIETLRKEYYTPGSKMTHHHNISVPKDQMNALGKALLGYIEQGIGYYNNLIERIETDFIKFNIREFIDFNFSNQTRVYSFSIRQRWMNKQAKSIKFALMCLNRSFISLGDLARYKELIFGAVDSNSLDNAAAEASSVVHRDYSQARLLYIKALQIAPRSSRAYHQLAVLAMYTRRRLDAVYYYFRCLEVSSPLTSVRQALNSLFDEARQKSDFIMKCIKQAVANRQKRKLNQEMNQSRNYQNDEKNRVEIWYKPPIGQGSSAAKDERVTTQKAPKRDNKAAKTAASALEKEEIDQLDAGEDEDEDEEESSSDDDESDHEEDFLDSLNTEEFESADKREMNEFRNATVKDKNLSVVDLNKRFMLNYLNSIGKLFSKVGMEQYPDVCSRMLHEFQELLSRQPCPLGKMRLLQITLINISIIDITLKQSSSNASFYNQPSSHVDEDQQPVVHRSQLLECAIQLSFDMFVLMAKRFTFLLKKYTKVHSNNKNSDEQDAEAEEEAEIKDANNFDNWQLFVPSIKLFVDWILCNSKICFPLPDQLPPDLGPVMNRWKIVASMLNLVHKLVNTTRYFEPSDQIEREIFKRVKLDEDIETAGFVPLLSLSRDDNYDSSDEHIKKMDAVLSELHNSDRAKYDRKVEKACNFKRLEKLCLFADYLCGLEQPIFKYDVVNSCYTPIAATTSHHAQSDMPNSPLSNPVLSRLIHGEDRRTISTCSSSSNTSNTGANEMAMESMASIKYFNDENNEEEANELLKLKEKRRQLQTKVEEQMKRDQSLVEMGKQRRLELEIRPKFVVPDTNCFIDHLNLINSILSTSYFIVVVPLLVINELDKLAKSIFHFNYDSVEHAEYVQRNAKTAIKYLTEKFDNRERNLKALTSQGSVLETIQFRSEEIRGHGTNDELILGCCLHYCRDSARDFMPKNPNDAIHLFREVVLLTEDRHLRLKAHTRNVPVKDIVHFCKWCNLLSHNSMAKNPPPKAKPVTQGSKNK